MAYRGKISQVRATPGGPVRFYRYDEGIVTLPVRRWGRWFVLVVVWAMLACVVGGDIAATNGHEVLGATLLYVGFGLGIAGLLALVGRVLSALVGIVVATVSPLRDGDGWLARRDRRARALIDPTGTPPAELAAMVRGGRYLPSGEIATVEIGPPGRIAAATVTVTVSTVDGERVSYAATGRHAGRLATYG